MSKVAITFNSFIWNPRTQKNELKTTFIGHLNGRESEWLKDTHVIDLFKPKHVEEIINAFSYKVIDKQNLIIRFAGGVASGRRRKLHKVNLMTKNEIEKRFVNLDEAPLLFAEFNSPFFWRHYHIYMSHHYLFRNKETIITKNFVDKLIREFEDATAEYTEAYRDHDGDETECVSALHRLNEARTKLKSFITKLENR